MLTDGDVDYRKIDFLNFQFLIYHISYCIQAGDALQMSMPLNYFLSNVYVNHSFAFKFLEII